jgi:tetratricopeptide (TPR) repeat protein
VRIQYRDEIDLRHLEVLMVRERFPWLASFTALLFVSVLLCGSFSALLLSARQAPDERFDMLVRGDMFAGMAGDSAALDRAMKLCEETLAKDPNDAQALVWHGSGLVYQGAQVMRTGDYAKGMPMLSQGLREMDEAVTKTPDQIAVLIPRGASLLEYSKHDPRPDVARAELEKGLGDYERVLTLQKANWETRPVHSRGELLSGLAEGWLRAGDAEKARSYMERLVRETPGSPYADRAQNFLDAAPAPKHLDWHCIGCHVANGSQ